MDENTERQQTGQSLIIIAFAIIVLLIFVVIAVDLAYGYVHRRGDQNAADASSLAGARVLRDIRNEYAGNLDPNVPEAPIQEAMNDYAERNGILDTDGTLANTMNANVIGYYLDENGNRLHDVNGQDLVIGELGYVDPDAKGIEAVVHSVAPSFFGGVMGLNGLPIEADAAVVFPGLACTAGCIAPIATVTMTFEIGECYNIWDGTRQMAEGDTCPDYGKCSGTVYSENGDSIAVCSKNDAVECTDDQDCKGVCSQTGICSLPQDDSRACANDGDCEDYGPCTGSTVKTCQNSPSLVPLACGNDADCVGHCQEAVGWVCSQSGNSCTDDSDCTQEGEYCEDGVGGGSSGLGWLNWSMQEDGSCEEPFDTSDCSADCLMSNMQNDSCLSGDIDVKDWIAGSSGIKTSGEIRTMLQCYANLPPGNNSPMCTNPGDPITVIVYDRADGDGCNQGKQDDKLRYRVAGFAAFQVKGYMLAQGSGSAKCQPGFDCENCIDWGSGGNRITGVFLDWVDGVSGTCDAQGTVTGIKLVK
jgi:hypothetical protein